MPERSERMFGKDCGTWKVLGRDASGLGGARSSRSLWLASRRPVFFEFGQGLVPEHRLLARVFGETPKTAVGTTALPEQFDRRPHPLLNHALPGDFSVFIGKQVLRLLLWFSHEKIHLDDFSFYLDQPSLAAGCQAARPSRHDRAGA